MKKARSKNIREKRRISDEKDVEENRRSFPDSSAPPGAGGMLGRKCRGGRCIRRAEAGNDFQGNIRGVLSENAAGRG